MDKWRGRIALVTGGSKGIGASIAAELVRHSMVVFACARNISSIEQSAEQLKDEQGKLHAIKCDLRVEGQILAMFRDIKRITDGRGVDVLINNCAIVPKCAILSSSTDTMKDMLNVNVLAPSICARETIKSMRKLKTDDGHIININSSSGQRISSSSSLHFYSATKFALTALTEGLRGELRQIKSHIRVTGVFPGVTDTATLDQLHTPAEKEALFAKLDGIIMQPDDVMSAVVYALSAPPHVQVQDLTIRPLFH